MLVVIIVAKCFSYVIWQSTHVILGLHILFPILLTQIWALLLTMLLASFCAAHSVWIGSLSPSHHICSFYMMSSLIIFFPTLPYGCHNIIFYIIFILIARSILNVYFFQPCKVLLPFHRIFHKSLRYGWICYTPQAPLHVFLARCVLWDCLVRFTSSSKGLYSSSSSQLKWSLLWGLKNIEAMAQCRKNNHQHLSLFP